MFKAVGEAGVVAPPDALVVREAAGALCFEVEEALGEGIGVVERLGLGQQNGKDGEKKSVVMENSMVV